MPLLMRRQMSARLLTAALIGSTVACSAGPLPPATEPLATWGTLGWTDLPATSATAPVERWRIPFSQDTAFSLDDVGTVLVVASPTSSSTRVQRLDIATGAPMWTAELPATELRTLKLLGAPPTAVVATGGRRAVVLHPDTGAVLADQSSDDGGVDVGMIRDLLLLDTVEGGTVAQDLTGRERWRTAAHVTVEGETLLARDHAAGTVAVLDPNNGTAVWSAPAPQLGGFHVVGERLIFWSDAGITGELARRLGPSGVPGLPGPVAPPRSAFALDLRSGARLWSVTGLPEIGSGRILGLGEDALLLTPGDQDSPSVALDATTGAVRWTAPAAPDLPFRVAGRTYVMETFARPAVHDATDGEEIDRIPDDTPFGNITGLASSMVFASTSDDLVAYGLPDLEERWRVRMGEVYGTRPLPHGVLVRTADALVALTSG